MLPTMRGKTITQLISTMLVSLTKAITAFEKHYNLGTQQKPSTRKTTQNRCLGNTRFYCNQASFTFLSSSFFHACFSRSIFRTPFVYIFACTPHFSFVKGYRLIAESLCFQYIFNQRAFLFQKWICYSITKHMPLSNRPFFCLSFHLASYRRIKSDFLKIYHITQREQRFENPLVNQK